MFQQNLRQEPAEAHLDLAPEAVGRQLSGERKRHHAFDSTGTEQESRHSLV